MGKTADQIGTDNLPVEDHGQNVQGNGGVGKGTPVGGLVGKAMSGVQSANDRNFDAMNEARAAMGLPKIEKKKSED